jgi:hypothetical protein
VSQAVQLRYFNDLHSLHVKVCQAEPDIELQGPQGETIHFNQASHCLVWWNAGPNITKDHRSTGRQLLGPTVWLAAEALIGAGRDGIQATSIPADEFEELRNSQWKPMITRALAAVSP